MTVSVVIDATHLNINAIPKGTLAALYTTGSLDIRATANDFLNHPNAVRICQDHGSDITADILDMETGAANPQDVITWLGNARRSFNNNMRPGQRWPGVYLSLSRLTEQANALVAAHDSNVPLWIAEWGLAQATALANINAANGPFPTVAFQIRNLGTSDFSLFSDEWLNRRSGMVTPVKPNVPPGPWNDPKQWDWKQVAVIGIGLDGKFHAFVYNPAAGEWTKVPL